MREILFTFKFFFSPINFELFYLNPPFLLLFAEWSCGCWYRWNFRYGHRRHKAVTFICEYFFSTFQSLLLTISIVLAFHCRVFYQIQAASVQKRTFRWVMTHQFYANDFSNFFFFLFTQKFISDLLDRAKTLWADVEIDV